MPIPPLHLVATEEVLRRPGFPALATSLLALGGGSVALHLRGPGLPGARLYELAARLAPAARAAGALLLVNDRVDVALAAGCHGVQLGGRSMSVADARALLGPHRPIGASIHSPEEAESVAGADFLIAGTLFPTASHPGRPGRGTGWLGELAGRGTPVIGIGGVTPTRAREAVAAGAAGVAVVRGVWDAESPETALREYLDALSGGR